MRLNRMHAAWGGALLILAAALTACAPDPTPRPSGPGSIDLDAVWLDGGRMLGVVTWGSSSCVPVAGDVAADGTTVTVTLIDQTPADGLCTSDIAPRITPVAVPAGVDPTAAVTVEATLTGATGTVDVKAIGGLPGPGTTTDYAPSAAWTEGGRMFAYLTWGSSSCPPVAEKVVASSETQVTLTFRTPEADRVCTLDIAPRVALAEVTGLTTPSGAQLVLTGDTFDDVTIPILGG